MIDSYDKLPLGRYLDLCAIDPALPDIDRQVAMVSVLSGIPEDDLLNMPVPDYSALAVKTAFLGEEPPEPKERIMREYRLGDLTLVPVTDVRRMTTAQFIDFQTYVREPDGHEADILTVFLVPKGKRYNDGYDVADVRAAILEHLSVTLAQDLRAFFFREVQGLCAGYPNLFGVADEEDTGSGDEEGDAGADSGGEDEFESRWGWVRNVDAVSETCRCGWDAVWDMAVTEFLNILSYRNDKIAKEQKDIERWQRTH